MTFTRRSFVLAAVFAVLASGAVFAQTDTVDHPVTMNVNAFNVVGVTLGTPVVLTLATVIAAGATPADDTQNDTYLQYTVVTPALSPQRITAEILSGSLIAGTELWVEATGMVGNEGGSAGVVVLAGPQDLITAIQSCATGTAGTDGAQLTYTLHVSNFAALVPGAAEVVNIQYTFL